MQRDSLFAPQPENTETNDAAENPDPVSHEAQNFCCRWVLDNPDVVAMMHAIRVELITRYVTAHVVPESEVEPFQYWLRFEFGENGNPHAHGECYVSGNPVFENVLRDESARQELKDAGRHDVDNWKTWEQAETEIAAFFKDYVREMHPCKDTDGRSLYPFLIENIQLPHCAKPQTINLLDLLEQVFDTDTPDLSRLKEILVALIETGQRHTGHSHRAPTYGVHPCARKAKTSDRKEYVYCRYLFPRDLYFPKEGKHGEVRDDPHRPDLRSLCRARNDTLINNFEEHMLLMNLGNIDWRALLNLWSVLEYLTKYTAKAGKGSKRLGTLFEDVLKKVFQYEEEDGLHDLWRRTIMKFYSRILGDREYLLFEVMHFGLRLPGTRFGPVNSISVSNWSAVKRGRALNRLKKDERATYLSKVELFNLRAHLELPRTVPVSRLESLSFYAFWRMYDVVKGRIVRRQREKITAVNGTGWPAQAKCSNPLHTEYAHKTLYAYMPCHHLRGTDYIDEAVAIYYSRNWTAALRAFARDENNLWCPPWIRRNYEIRNKENPVE